MILQSMLRGRSIQRESSRLLFRFLSFLPLTFLVSAFGQTTINLATQGKDVDFANFTFTRPVEVGTATPATCQVGQLFFNSASPSGQNLLGCTATNIWAQFGGGATGSSNALTGLTGDVTATGPGNAPATLATVNSAPGQCGDATHVCQITTNGKGLVTAQTAVAVTGSGGGTLTVESNGTSQGTVTTLNFSTNLTSTVSGGVATISALGGGSGQCSQYASQLNDFVPAYTSANGGTIVVNPYASSSSPSIVQVGPSTFYQGISSVSAYVSSGTADTAYGYIDGMGNFDIGTSTASLTCTGCSLTTGITAFPIGSKPLFTWAISGGEFISSGYTDYRAFLSTASDQVAPPANSSSPCTAGQWATGSSSGTSYFYSCVATNTWQRVALSSF